MGSSEGGASDSPITRASSATRRGASCLGSTGSGGSGGAFLSVCLRISAACLASVRSSSVPTALKHSVRRVSSSRHGRHTIYHFCVFSARICHTPPSVSVSFRRHRRAFGCPVRNFHTSSGIMAQFSSTTRKTRQQLGQTALSSGAFLRPKSIFLRSIANFL